MNEVNAKEFVPKPVTVKIGDREYRLIYSMKAVILYKQRTAIIDQRRTEGVGKLSPEVIADYNRRQAKLLEEAAAMYPEDLNNWPAAERAKYDALVDEAVQIKCLVDADRGTGDSLFDPLTWRKIDPIRDPERVIAALWAGVQTAQAGVAEETLLRAIDLSNAAEITIAIATALSSYIRRSEAPNGEPPAAVTTMPAGPDAWGPPPPPPES
jgi:hypothetical protein